jgi:acyl CoA:acetate/3-ketoacid CoA transferase alpha subunit
MSKWCKIFEFEDGDNNKQILFQLDSPREDVEGEVLTIKTTIEYDGMFVSIHFGYDDYEKAQKNFDDIMTLDAKRFLAEIEEYVKSFENKEEEQNENK